MPQEFYNRFKYIHVASSSGCLLLNLNVVFKLIIRRFEAVLRCLEWECFTFFGIENTMDYIGLYTMDYC